MTTEAKPKTGRPQIITLDRALKLAEKWVDNMSKLSEDEPTYVAPEGRPPRLGLGAKVSLQANIGPSNDPVERKLQGMLNAGKRNAAKKAEEFTLSTRDGHSSNDEDDDSESRTRTLTKKRTVPPTSSLQDKKKHR